MYRPTNTFPRKECLAQKSGAAFPTYQRNKFAIRNVTGCGYLTAICYRNIPALHIL